MSGFEILEEDFDRVFMTEQEIIDRYVGNRLWSWGNNSEGNLGDGTSTSRSSPGTTAGAGVNWLQVSANGNLGIRFAAGVKTDGTLWTWGANVAGKLGDSTTTSKSSPVTTSGGGTNWRQVSCGTTNTAAVKTDGTLWTWGATTSGSLGDNSSTASRSSPGTTAGGGTNWRQVSAGGNLMGAIKTDGTLWVWGAGANGGLGDGTTTNKSSPVTTAGGGTTWKQVAATVGRMVAVKTDGTLWTWGRNTRGQLGDGTTTSRSSPGTTAGGGTTWKQVSTNDGTNDGHTAAIKIDGTLWTWGENVSGEQGTGNTTSRSSPGTTAGGGTNWKQVSCGYRTTAAVKIDGTLWTWGAGTNGVMGDNTITPRSSPGTTVSNSNVWKSTTAGNVYTFGIAD
jgi:alpha-tubulin suppressor-like RCC1 family protein